LLVAMVVGLVGGILLGFSLDISYPTEYSFYITMGLLAAIDSIVGAARSYLEGKYNNLIFITGFVTNAILAGLLG
jgi:small basic protein